MYFEFHRAAILSCKVLLRPIVELFLGFGLSYREFAEMAKFSYLSAATKDISTVPNISQIAVRTGISRKAVKKLLARQQQDQILLSTDGLNHLRLIELWREDPKYLDSNGLPLALNYTGDYPVTLLGLINKLGTDVPPSSLLKRLLSMDLVDIDENGKYSPKTQDPTPSIPCPDTLVRSSLFAAAHIDTITNNFDDNSEKKRMERQSYSVRVPRELRDDLLNQIRALCNETFSEVEKIIGAHEVSGKTDSREIIGIGMYSFDFQLPMEDLGGVFDGIGH